jgi:hypothetical protein
VHGCGYIEIGNDGIPDFGFTAGAEVKAGTDVFEAVDINPIMERVATDLTVQAMPESNRSEVSAGAIVRVGILLSAATFSGTGLLKI